VNNETWDGARDGLGHRLFYFMWREIIRAVLQHSGTEQAPQWTEEEMIAKQPHLGSASRYAWTRKWLRLLD